MKKLDPKAVWLFLFSFMIFVPVIGGLILYLIWSFFTIDTSVTLDNVLIGFFAWLWLLVPALIILSFVWAKLTVHFYRYELTEAGFRKELGVIYKNYITIPYDRIQNVDINRGIIDRLLGLSTLMVYTAGTASAIGEGTLPGLSREVAEQLRDELIARARQSKNQGL